MDADPDRTRVKLCGLRDVDDARAAVAAGADLVGIVFVGGAARAVAPDRAAQMVRAVHETADRLRRLAPEIVGIVGPMSPAAARELVAATGIDAVQLVGPEDACAELADALAGTPLIRAIAVPDDADVSLLRATCERWQRAGARVTFDAAVHGQLGGTGRQVRRDLVRDLLACGGHGLAGGLDPDNVGVVVRELSPALVDVSSGIEDACGQKDAARMQAFVAAVRPAAVQAHAAEVHT